MVAPATPGADPGTPAPALVTTTVTTANINSAITGTARRTAYAEAATGTDILCTQEDHTTPDSGALMPNGWATYQAGTRRCSVHWRADLFTQNSVRTLLLNLANGLTFPGASRKAATVVLTDRRNGKRVKVTCVHFVPHADDDKRSGVLTPMPRGRKAVIPAINALISDAEDHPEQVQVIAGDVNVDLQADLRIHDQGLAERLESAGFVAISSGPTHGRDEYDQIWVNGARIASQKVQPKGKSDHRAKSAVITY